MGMLHKGGNAVPFHGDHHPVKVSTHRTSRNLFDTNYFNSTCNGVTFSTDVDGVITLNGQATRSFSAYYYNNYPAGTYSISVRFVTPHGDESNKYLGVRVRNSKNKQYVQFIDTGIDYASAQVENEAYQQLKIEIVLKKDISYDNYKLQIQFEEGPEATSFEPYGLIEEPIFEPIDQAQDGKTLTFENTYNDAAEVTVFGESTQKTMTGKNLIPFPYVSYEGIKKGIEWTFNSDGSISAHGTANIISYACINGGYAQQMRPIPSWLVAGKTYTFSFDRTLPRGVDAYIYKYTSSSFGSPYFAIYQGNQSKTFTMPSDLSDWLYFGIFLAVLEGATVDFDALFPQIEKGSIATEYEPYCGGIPSPNPDYPQPIESIKSVELVSRNADGSKSAIRTIDIKGHELRSLPDGTRDELVVHMDGTVELVQRCDASMFDPSYPVSNDWKLADPQTIQLPSINPLPTYHPYTVVDGNGADISSRVRVFE